MGQSGSEAPGWWWSVTIVSMPRPFACSTSSTEVMPQSTVIKSPVPRDARRSIVAG